MKLRFNGLDIKSVIYELSQMYTGLRVTNVYDVDHKTYLIKLSKPDDKAMILIESGIRIHSTGFDWPKNLIPSGFSMKMRKHLKSKRLEKIVQLGNDRIVDMQFGSGEAAYHLILELYDKGNILLTDFEYTIVSVLRPRTDENADVRFAVREKYPLHTIKEATQLTIEHLRDDVLKDAKEGDDLKKLLTSKLSFGSVVIDHCLNIAGFPDKCQIGKNFNIETDIEKLFNALQEADKIFKIAETQTSKGYIIQKKTKAVSLEKNKPSEGEDILTNEEFHSYLFKKYENTIYVEYDSFDKAVDEFFSKLEGQKFELKILQQNKEAIKKLENVKKDHEKRIEDLQRLQSKDELYATLIEDNLELVDRAIYLVNNAIANQLDWNDINEIIDEAKDQGHPVASAIKTLKLDINHIVLLLKNIYDYEEDENNYDNPKKVYDVEIDLGLTAFKNSKKYYDHKKSSVAKEQKTIDASDKALKNAEKRTIEALKQVKKNVAVTKSRKLFCSENYLIIGGRDQQQNELLVKRHLKAGDLYVHADLHGASSIIIKNPSGDPVPPKTLNEAGCMAICYSVAWEAKVTASAYWVYHHQVSKQAQTGEYLVTGSFMIRGKKNYIPQTALVFGFALLYKLEEGSLERHLNERRVRTLEDQESVVEQVQEQAEDDGNNDEVEDIIKKFEEMGDEKDDGEDEDDDRENKEDVLQEDEKPELENESEARPEIVEIAQNSEVVKDDNEEVEFPDTSFQMKLVPQKGESSDEEQKKERTISATSRPYVTKKQRKDMKKAKKPEDNTVTPKEEPEGKLEAEESDSDDEQKQEVTQLKGDKSQTEKPKPLKRGQKAKLAKIKQKYKDQDDEDRELVMQYLAPAGKQKVKEPEKPDKKTIQQQKQQQQQAVKRQQQQQLKKQVVDLQTVQHTEENPGDDKDLLDDDDGAKVQEDEINIVDSLTGLPVPEDELLFCVAMTAPYSAIQNYKHKVKLIPGTTKKGQAIKTAFEIFIRDKVTSQNEKDLIKSLKEVDLARNLPGKVKVSAPNLQKIKKKK